MTDAGLLHAGLDTDVRECLDFSGSGEPRAWGWVLHAEPTSIEVRNLLGERAVLCAVRYRLLVPAGHRVPYSTGLLRRDIQWGPA